MRVVSRSRVVQAHEVDEATESLRNELSEGGTKQVRVLARSEETRVLLTVRIAVEEEPKEK